MNKLQLVFINVLIR